MGLEDAVNVVGEVAGDGVTTYSPGIPPPDPKLNATDAEPLLYARPVP